MGRFLGSRRKRVCSRSAQTQMHVQEKVKAAFLRDSYPFQGFLEGFLSSSKGILIRSSFSLSFAKKKKLQACLSCDHNVIAWPSEVSATILRYTSCAGSWNWKHIWVQPIGPPMKIAASLCLFDLQRKSTNKWTQKCRLSAYGKICQPHGPNKNWEDLPY